jgi:hypothetical protein
VPAQKCRLFFLSVRQMYALLAIFPWPLFGLSLFALTPIKTGAVSDIGGSKNRAKNLAQKRHF